MKRAVPLPFALAVPMPAYAEVCDKARPLWGGEKVNQAQELFVVRTTPTGFGAISLVVLAVLARKSWF